MAYRVFWAPAAEARLEELAQLGPDPAEIAAAARDLDRRLVSDPKDSCESRDYPLRIGFVLPLGALIEVMSDVRTVIVHDVWRIG
jgi:hypothetical protein